MRRIALLFAQINAELNGYRLHVAPNLPFVVSHLYEGILNIHPRRRHVRAKEINRESALFK